MLTGGNPRPDLGPWFFEPTVLVGVRPACWPPTRRRSGRWSRSTRSTTTTPRSRRPTARAFGLNASVWTTDRAPWRRQVAKRLRYGSVNVNEGYAAVWGSHDLPLGGMKASGLGRRHGREGILRYTESQSIAVQRLHGIAPLGGMGYDRFADVVTRAFRAVRRTGRP